MLPKRRGRFNHMPRNEDAVAEAKCSATNRFIADASMHTRELEDTVASHDARTRLKIHGGVEEEEELEEDEDEDDEEDEDEDDELIYVN